MMCAAYQNARPQYRRNWGRGAYHLFAMMCLTIVLRLAVLFVAVFRLAMLDIGMELSRSGVVVSVFLDLLAVLLFPSMPRRSAVMARGAVVAKARR